MCYFCELGEPETRPWEPWKLSDLDPYLNQTTHVSGRLVNMRILAEWVDEPFPLVECEAHTFAPFADLRSAHTYRCTTCGRLAIAHVSEREDER